MCYRHVSRVLGRLNMLPVPRFQNFLCPGSDDGCCSNKSVRWDVSKVFCQKLVESIEVKTHFPLKLKLSKKNFGGILRPKSVKRTGQFMGREQKAV